MTIPRYPGRLRHPAESRPRLFLSADKASPYPPPSSGLLRSFRSSGTDLDGSPYGRPDLFCHRVLSTLFSHITDVSRCVCFHSFPANRGKKNGRPGRSESARLFLRGETVHPIIFSDFFRIAKHRPLKLFWHKGRIKLRFLSINVVRTRFLFIDL